MRIAIIEDEKLVAEELKATLTRINKDIHVQIVLDGVLSALEWFNRNPMPDLIFSDIYLSDGISFDIFRNLKEHAPVIFCTAYDQYALEAFENNGIDYLLKPISEENLARCIKKVNKIKNGLCDESELHQTLRKALARYTHRYRTSIMVYEKNKIIAIDLSEICFFVAEKQKCLAVTRDASYYLEDTLEQLIPTLDPLFFFRANRQYIINKKAVKYTEVLPLRKLAVMLTGARESIVISREKKRSFLSWMEGL